MLRTYRTPKGTELPLLNLRGREYLEVKYRLVWFREEHPDWAIETELLSVTADSAYARAVVKDDSGRVIATSHKFETKKGFPDFIEKAETGAIGRALALIGFGTQFCADELDEGDRIVDAPVEPRRAELAEDMAKNFAQLGTDVVSDFAAGDEASEESRAGGSTSAARDPGDYRISFGKKYKGLKLRDVPAGELEGYIEWLEENAARKGLPLSEEARFLKVAVERYLHSVETSGKESAKPGARAGSRTETIVEDTKH